MCSNCVCSKQLHVTYDMHAWSYLIVTFAIQDKVDGEIGQKYHNARLIQ